MYTRSREHTRREYTASLDERELDELLSELDELLRGVSGVVGYGRAREFYYQLKSLRVQDTFLD